MYCSTQEIYAQTSFFSRTIDQQIDLNNRYVLLANQIPWEDIRNVVEPFYSSDYGRPALSVRMLSALNIVKYLENVSDARAIQLYTENPYIQYFCGAIEFQTECPCSDVSLSNFRKRIGEDGCKAILAASVSVHNLGDENIEVQEVVLDTTAQCKNIAYPNDINLLIKVAEGCVKIAHKYGIKLKNTYEYQIKECLKVIRFEKSTKKEKMKNVRKAKKRIYTIAYSLYREIKRKMTKEQQDNEEENLLNFYKVINQSNINKRPVTLLREKINNISEKIDEATETCQKNNIDIPIKTIKKINSLKESFKNATGRALEKTLSGILSSLKRIADRLIKLIKNYFNSNIKVEIEENVKDELNKILSNLYQVSKDNRIYSLHEPHVRCITKGKVGVEHEYGSKASIAITKTSAVIVGACNFEGNVHDSNTVTKTVDNVQDNTGRRPEDCWVDRGYRGAQDKNIDITVHIPSTPTSDMSEDEKKEARANFGRRSSIEPVIGHVKNDFRLRRNFLKGELGDSINLLLACAAFNFKKWINNQIKNLNEVKKHTKK